jgi:hypothetical protein
MKKARKYFDPEIETMDRETKTRGAQNSDERN